MCSDICSSQKMSQGQWVWVWKNNQLYHFSFDKKLKRVPQTRTPHKGYEGTLQSIWRFEMMVYLFDNRGGAILCWTHVTVTWVSWSGMNSYHNHDYIHITRCTTSQTHTYVHTSPCRHTYNYTGAHVVTHTHTHTDWSAVLSSVCVAHTVTLIYFPH